MNNSNNEVTFITKEISQTTVVAPQWILSVMSGQKIKAIREIRQLTSITNPDTLMKESIDLRRAKMIVDDFMNHNIKIR